MKTSWLTRLLALFLAVISLSMLVSGALGMRSAAKDRRKGENEVQDLQQKIDDYRDVRALLMDSAAYGSLNERLKKQQEKYDNETARHRTALTTYTATNSGLQIGMEALAQAQALLTAGKTQYEAGRKTLETQLKAFEKIYQMAVEGRSQLATAYTVLETADDAVYNLNMLLSSLKKIGNILELPPEAYLVIPTPSLPPLPELPSAPTFPPPSTPGQGDSFVGGNNGTDSNNTGSAGNEGNGQDSGTNPNSGENGEAPNAEPASGNETSAGDGNTDTTGTAAETDAENEVLPETGYVDIGNSDHSGLPLEGTETMGNGLTDEPTDYNSNELDNGNGNIGVDGFGDGGPDPEQGTIEEPGEEFIPAPMQDDDPMGDNLDLYNQAQLLTEPSAGLLEAADYTNDPLEEDDQQCLDEDTQIISAALAVPALTGTIAQTEVDNQPQETETALDQQVPKSPLTGPLSNEEAMSQTAAEAAVAVKYAQYAIADIETILDTVENQEIPASVVQQALRSAGIRSASDLKEVLKNAGIELTSEQEAAIDATMNQGDTIMLPAEQLREIRSTLKEAEQVLADLQRQIDAANSGNPEMSAAEFGALRMQYTDNKDDYQGMISELETEIANLDYALNDAKVMLGEAEAALLQLDEAKAAIDQALAALDGAGSQITDGEAALADGEAQLLEAKEAQRKKAEELDKEKRSLDQQEKALQLSASEAETQKDREDRELSLRLDLLSRPEIKELTEQGADLLTASDSWLSALTNKTQEDYRDRFDASMLMIACAILALIGALASFGTGPNRMLVVLATLLCQAFAISAGVLLYRMGRGISWSSLITVLLATAELACVLPEFVPKTAPKQGIRRPPMQTIKQTENAASDPITNPGPRGEK